MYPLDEAFYSPSLRAKKGEIDAYFLLDEPSKDRLLAQLVLPSLLPKEESTSSADDIMSHMVKAIAHGWGSRPCLLDVRFVAGDESLSADLRIEQLLRRLHLVGSRPIPVIGLAADFYRASAVSKYIEMSKSGAALRVTLNDLGSPQLEQLIETQLTVLGIPSTDCLLILDLSDADLSEQDILAKFIDEWQIKLHSFGPWYKVVVHASNYPQLNPAKVDGDRKIRPRTEWQVWQRLLKLDANTSKLAMFGDFGADHGHISYKPGGRAPITHLRYTTPTDYEIFRGGANQGTIRNVAKRIVDSGVFFGELFSWGDEFIASRARGAGDAGYPTTWRTVNMNHHMTLVTLRLGELLGISVPQINQRRTSVQEALFAPMEPAK